MSRILALDYGSKRIGVALSDETKKIAFAKPYVSRNMVSELVMLVAEEEVSEIIMGLPLSLSGEEAAAAENARKFAEALTEATGLAVKLIDERFSTKEVLRETRENKGYWGNKGDRGDKGIVDSLVAQKMLQNYLDHNA